MALTRTALHLDTNVLILALDPEHALRARLTQWRHEGGSLAVSAIAWAEFLCGPITQDVVRRWEAVIRGAIIPVDRRIAERAAALFNRTGRRSRSLPDCVVAATAILSGAPLITLNVDDFTPFEGFGLSLA